MLVYIVLYTIYIVYNIFLCIFKCQKDLAKFSGGNTGFSRQLNEKKKELNLKLKIKNL